ncbi:MAG: VOC family protein [Desulfovibrionaceae bacterium]
MRYTGINHLAMATGDMNATIRFWRDLLGMRLVAALGRPGYRHYFFEISAQDMIAFFEWPGVEPGPEKDHGAPVTGPHTFDHVAVGVGSDDDLWELKARLEAADVWVSEVVDHGFIHSIYSFDPNNIAIEFSAPVPGLDPRARPITADSEPVAEALAGAEPQAGAWPAPAAPIPPGGRVVYEGMGSELAEGLKEPGQEDA